MIRLSNIKIPVSSEEDALKKKIETMCKGEKVRTIKIIKMSLDARQKSQLYYVYQVAVTLENEERFLKRKHSFPVDKYKEPSYQLPKEGTEKLTEPPVIIGAGPAGLFCALVLARRGFSPVIIERGKTCRERKQDVEDFWKTGILNPNSNVIFGEGGAGTFSDGKLNTLVHDPLGRNSEVLKVFVEHGAPEQILYQNKPHIGTDVLLLVLEQIRDEIKRLGGVFYFSTQVIDFQIENKNLKAITLKKDNEVREIPVSIAVLAIGHSARDTFELLNKKGLSMESKAFAVGFRMEHPQELINESQYGKQAKGLLPAADYKLTYTATNQRGVYSFCMCPGGFVVNASSEMNRLAVNGMSYSKRDGINANSALIVSVTPDDYPSKDPLGGVEFQRQIEENAFQAGQGKIPQQLYGDFKENLRSTSYGSFQSATCGMTQLTNLRDILPEALNQSLLEGIEVFGKRIRGFSMEDGILSGVESRTSSPVRIHRDEEFLSSWKGLYPCGEGAGYAGGIMSAAMDGLKVAEKIIETYSIK